MATTVQTLQIVQQASTSTSTSRTSTSAGSSTSSTRTATVPQILPPLFSSLGGLTVSSANLGVSAPTATSSTKKTSSTRRATTSTTSAGSPGSIAQHSSSSPSSSSTTPDSAQSHSPEAQASTKNGLSTGAAVGIAIAATVVVIAIFGALGYLWYRRRRARRDGITKQREGPRGSGPDNKKNGVAAGEKKADGEQDEAAGTPYELSGKSKARELETMANRHELDAQRRQEMRYELPD